MSNEEKILGMQDPNLAYPAPDPLPKLLERIVKIAALEENSDTAELDKEGSDSLSEVRL